MHQAAAASAAAAAANAAIQALNWHTNGCMKVPSLPPLVLPTSSTIQEDEGETSLLPTPSAKKQKL
jgi:hypothetical protein